MQEMAAHLRQAYKEKEAPPDVQAFLDKAEKEFSRNNIKSLQAATKSLDHAQKALRDAVQAKKEHRLQWTKHVGDGVKIWETQLESFRVHQAALSEQASKARAEIELSRRILKEVSESSVKEGNLSIPQPIQEETEDANTDNAVDPEEQKLRDQLQGVLNACAGSLGLQATEVQIQEVSDDDQHRTTKGKDPWSLRRQAKVRQSSDTRPWVSSFEKWYSWGPCIHVSKRPLCCRGKGLFESNVSCVEGLETSMRSDLP